MWASMMALEARVKEDVIVWVREERVKIKVKV